MELLERLEAAPTTRYQSRDQGQIFQILFDDINNLRAFIGFGLLQVGNLIIAGWVLIPKLNQTDAYLWPAFTPLFISVILFTIVTMVNQRYFKQIMDTKGEVQQYIIETYEAKQSIKNFHREDSFVQGFVNISAKEFKIFFKSAIGFAITGPYVKLGLGISLLWAAILIRANNGNTSDLVFFSGFLYLFLEPVMFLSWVAVVISQGLAAWKRVKELHDVIIVPSDEEKELTDNKELLFWGKPLNLALKPHRWNVLVGETGSGKTYLLTKFATSQILAGNKVSMVQQEPYLFNDTIAENIFLGKTITEKDKEKAYSLLKMFQLDSLAPTLDDVLRLEVGENGKRLSGGQMKRVALVRSLLSGAKTLIWDDPFSSVDIILERKIMNSLRREEEWKDATFFISSHRLTTVRLSDEVIFIHKDFGIKLQGHVDTVLKDKNVIQFFKEQLVELPLA